MAEAENREHEESREELRGIDVEGAMIALRDFAGIMENCFAEARRIVPYP